MDITGTVKAESYAIVIAKNGSFDLLAQLILNAEDEGQQVPRLQLEAVSEERCELNVEPTFCQQYAEEPLPQRS